MKVLVKLFGEYRRFQPPDAESPVFWLDVQEGTTLMGLLDLLQILRDSPKTLVHNHRAGKEETLLQEGDTVAVFPPVAGGG
jgi:molybdopterin converting factor small subunit